MRREEKWDGLAQKEKRGGSRGRRSMEGCTFQAGGGGKKKKAQVLRQKSNNTPNIQERPLLQCLVLPQMCMTHALMNRKNNILMILTFVVFEFPVRISNRKIHLKNEKL